MNVQRLLQHFDRISEAPDAIPRLRRFILDLAVRGKLVDQDPKDEPVNAFDAAEGHDTATAQFAIPRTWRWVRLSALGKLKGGGTPSKSRGDFWQGSIPWVSPKDMKCDYIESTQLSITREAVSGSAVTMIEPGGILFVVRGMILAHSFPVALACVALTINQDMKALVLHHPEMGDFVLRALKGLKPQVVSKVKRSSHGTGRLEGADYRGLLIPIPPIPEQHRIVAKLDELLALCDRLEDAKAAREQRRDYVVAASFHHLNQSPDGAAGDDKEAFRARVSFTLNNLAHICTRPAHIQQIKDALLELAVTGKLTEQRATDGDAKLPLNRLNHGRRTRLRAASADTVEGAELPFLPDTWRWATIDHVAAEGENAITDGPFGANLKTAHYIDTPGYRVIRLQNIARGHFRMEHRTYIDADRFQRLAKHHVFPGDLVVAGLVDPLVRCCEVPVDIGPALVKADCYRFKVHPEFSSRFALYYLNSLVCQRLAAVHHHGMTLVRIGLGNFRLIPIPVPPLAEQHRIVAKVDELMALCDQLEAQLASIEADSRRLLEAVLHEALAPVAEEAV